MLRHPLVIASYDLVEQYCGAARHVMGAFGVVRFHGHAAKWRRKSSLGNGGGGLLKVFTVTRVAVSNLAGF